MIECLFDALLDTLKLLPYLLVTFWVLELIEHKLSKKSTKALSRSKKCGPVVGGILGGFPQCGFSAMGANLFSSRVITMGTLIAIFLSTSDEMLPIMLSENVNFLIILKIIGFKVLIGIIIGFIVDLLYNKKEEKNSIKEICEHEHCHCDKDGVIVSSIKHTLKTGLFILIANVLIGLIIFYVGEDNIKEVLLNKNIFTYLVASLFGLIPNCAPSVIMTELYLSNMITVGTLLSGLLTGSGLGILLLFKSNKDFKENITILSIIYFVGVIIGIVLDLFI